MWSIQILLNDESIMLSVLDQNWLKTKVPSLKTTFFNQATMHDYVYHKTCFK